MSSSGGYTGDSDKACKQVRGVPFLTLPMLRRLSFKARMHGILITIQTLSCWYSIEVLSDKYPCAKVSVGGGGGGGGGGAKSPSVPLPF